MLFNGRRSAWRAFSSASFSLPARSSWRPLENKKGVEKHSPTPSYAHCKQSALLLIQRRRPQGDLRIDVIPFFNIFELIFDIVFHFDLADAPSRGLNFKRSLGRIDADHFTDQISIRPIQRSDLVGALRDLLIGFHLLLTRRG